MTLKKLELCGRTESMIESYAPNLKWVKAGQDDKEALRETL